MIIQHSKPKRQRLKGEQRTEFRRLVCEAAHSRCLECGRWAPLYDPDGVFDVFTCGHISHIKSIGAGGGDTVDNVKWKCYHCHIGAEHAPRWSR